MNLPPEYETSIYVNANGGITISQEATETGAFVVFASKQRCLEVAKLLRKLALTNDFVARDDKEDEP